MVNDKYVVKYLDPRTGKYEYATVKDVGDLQKLNTKVKTSIVDAINSISANDIEGLKNGLDAIGKTIKSLEDGTLGLGDFQSIDDVVSREIEDAINSLKDENSGLLKLTQEEIDKIVSDAESEYRDSIAASVRELETSKSDLEDAREKMTNIGQMLENADIDYSNLTQVVDDINLYITDVIEKTDFDMVNGIVSDYKTAVTQTEDGWGVDASRNMLSYLTGRVKSNETSLDVQHGLIQAKVGKDEFQYMTVDNLPDGKENMLHNTSDLRDWDFSSAFIFKSADDYRFTSIVQSDSAGENIIGTTDELEQGATYAISTYVNVQNKNKKPNEEKYAQTDGNYTATVIIDGDTIELNNVVEDNSALDGWKRVSGTFIAKRTAQQDIKFYVTEFNRNTHVGYLSAPKLEKGSKATSWIPHIEDNVSTILSQNAVMRVLSDRITSSVEEVRETKGAFETATSTFDQMADGFALNTNKLSEVLDKYGEVTGVQTQQASELKVLNESITSKVWKQDINTTLDTINIDTSNRIVNSAFNIYSYDEQTGALKLDYWDNNTGFAIKKHSQSLDNYLYAKRSNATSVNPISIKSSPFALRDGEKILFNFEYLAVGNPLDDDNVFTLEMYDNDDVRVGLQEFRLSELKREFLTAYDVGDSYKYNGTYIVKNSSVVKGTITLKLPKNGELWLTKIMLQNAGIGTIGWTPSSIDNQIIQSKLSTEINQLADSIELVATDERLDAINGLLVKKDGKIVISPEAIISRVTSQTLGDNALITQTSLMQTEDNLRFDLVDKDGIIQTINASAEGLLIDFDKVYIDGEVIARMISAQAIDVTQGFRLTDNNGNTLLAVVNDNGKPTLSITRDFRIKFGEIDNRLDVTIVGVVEEYYYSVDPDEPIGGRWTSTPNAFQGGDNRFIWKRTKIIYQSGDTSYYPNETGVNITGSWEYEKESVTAEVVKALDSAEDAKELAVSEANQAMIDANKYADEQDALIRQQVETSVSNAISEADQARQIATDSYNNAVAKAEELAEAQSEAFNKKFEENASEMDTLSQAAQDADAKAQDALEKAGINANTLTTHQNTLNTIKNTTIPNINISISDVMSEAELALSSAGAAMSEAELALSSAGAAMSEALKTDGKIAAAKASIDDTISDVNTTAQSALEEANKTDGKIATLRESIGKDVNSVRDTASTALSKANTIDSKISTVNTTITDLDTKLSNSISTTSKALTDQIGSASSKAQQALDEANKADGKIADYVTRNGLVSGTTVDSKINTATGEISKKITTVEGKIDGLQVGGRNYVLNSAFTEEQKHWVLQGERNAIFSNNTVILSSDNELSKENDSVYQTLNIERDVKVTASVLVKGEGVLRLRFGQGDTSKKDFTINSPDEFIKVYADFPHTGNQNFMIMLVGKGELVITNAKLERGNVATDWTPAPEDILSQSEFQIFESTYNEDVKGITSRISTVENSKVDNNTYTDFYENEYKRTAKDATDAFTAVNKIVSEDGTVKDVFSKAVYEQNASRQSADFNEVTKDLVRTATYESGIDGVKEIITSVEGKVDNIKVGGRNFILDSGEPLIPRGVGSGGITASTTEEGYLQVIAEPVNGNYFYFTQLWDLRANSQIINNFKQGDDLTFSIDIKSPDSTDVPTLYVYGSGSIYRELVGVMGTEFSRFHLTVNLKDSPIPVNIVMGIAGKTGTFIFRNPKIEKGTMPTGWTPAPEDNLSDADFRTFESEYSRNSKEITERLSTVENSKLDGSTYTDFYENSYKKTAKDATDAYTAVNRIIDSDGNSTENFAKAVYERNAQRQKSDFESATEGLLKTATYEEGIDGIKNSLSEVEGKIPTSVGGRNYLLNSGKPGALTFSSNNGSIYPIVKGVENGVDWFYQTYADGTQEFIVSTYIGESYTKDTFGRKFSKDLEGYDGIVTYSVDVMSEQPITLRLNLSNAGRDKQTTLVPNQWTRLVTTMPITNYSKPMSLIADVKDNVGIPAGTKLYWRNYKIEKGNIATDYSLAPEDTLLESDFKSFQADYEQNAQGITSRLSSAENSITTNNQAFTTFKENDYKRTAERVSDTFTKQETTTMLGGKADASQLSNYLAKSTYERDAEQSKERFETIESDLDNISVGGRNLFRNSNFANELHFWQWNGQVTRVKVDGKDAILLTGTNNGFFQTPTQVEGGVVYTISFKAKSVGDSSQVRFGFLNQPTGNVGAEYIDNTWKTYSFTTSGDIDTKLNTYVHFYALRDTAEGVYITDLKIEKGTIATDWSPAVEDMANLSYVNSEVTKSAEAIKTSLANYAKTTDLNGLATETYATNQAVSEAGKVKNELTKYAKTTDLTGLASETYATNVAVSEAGKVSSELTKYAKTTALTGLATETYAKTQATTEAGKVEQKLTGYAKTTDLNGLATETYATNKAVAEAGKVSSELTKYELKTGVDSKISTASSALRTETAEKMKTVYTKSETETLLGKKADNSALNNYVQTATYESGIDGVSQSLTRVEGKIPTELGGRNYYTRATPLSVLETVSSLTKDYDINGFKATGASSGNRRFRIHDVIKSNGDWTISGYFRGTQNVTVRFTVNINDRATSEWFTSTTDNTWKYFEFSSNVTNQSTTYNFINFQLSSWAHYEFKDIKVEKGSIPTDWSPAPEDTLTQDEYKAFKSDYESTVQGITGQITSLSTSKLDGNTYTNFLSNDYKTTAERATSAFTKVNKVIDANGNSTDAFAKAVYDRNATRQTADFKTVTDGLVKTATYEDGIDGVKQSITSVRGDLDKIGSRNYFVRKEENVNKLFSWSNGIVSNETGSIASDLIEVQEGDVFSSNERISQIGFYDSNKVYLGALQGESSLSKTSGGTYANFTVPSGKNIYFMRVTYRNNIMAGKTIDKIKIMLNKGNVALDWSPAPEEMLGQADFQVFKNTYESNDQTIKNRLTAIDSGKDGSILYKTNEALSTAQGNTREISSVKGKIDDLSGAKNLLKQSWHNSEDSPAIVNNNYGIKSWDLEKPLEVGKTYTFRLFGFSNREYFTLYTPNGMMALAVGMSNGDSSVIRTDNPYNGLKNRRIWEKTFTLSQTQYNNMVANRVVLYNYPSSNSGNGEVYWATLVEGTAGIDWSPSLTDNLGKAEFTVFKNTYEDTSEKILNRLTAIDSGKDGSVIYNANEALKTAKGNTTSITNLNTKVDGLKIGGRNLISGTDDLSGIFGSGYGGSTAKYYKDYAVSASEWGKDTKATRVVITSASGTSGVFTTTNHFKMIYGKPYTLSLYVKNLGQNRIQFNLNGLMVNPDGTGSQSIYVNGGESGKFSVTGYMRNNPEWNWFQILPTPASGVTSMDFAIAYLQVEEGNFATDWTPALADQMGKAEFTVFKNDYDETAEGILSRLTAIDSSAAGSVVTRLNKTESTANGNSTLISTINSNYVKQSNIDASILADKKIKDTRSTNQLPSWYFTNYPSQEVREFKNVSAMGIGSGTYGILTTNVPWTSTSGGTVKQTFETNEGIHTRQGNSGATAWGAWVKQIDTADSTYQKITQTSELYERVLGSTNEAGVKNNISSIVQTSEIIQQTVTSAMNVENRNLLVTKSAKNDTWLVGSETYPNPSVATNNGVSTSPDLIAVSAGDKFTLSKNETTLFFRVSFLDSAKKYIGRYTQNAKSSVITPPANTAYLWVSYPTNADAKIEKGSIYTGYSPAPEDTATQSQITQLADNINLKVKADNLVSEINLASEGVRIVGKNIQLDGNIHMTSYFQVPSANIKELTADKITGTTAQFASLRSSMLTANTITSTMINANTALFDMLFSTTSATTRLVARGAWITNANIVSLDASKINAGTIDTARLNAGAIVTAGLSANVVKSTHIQGDTALIDKVFATTALINQLTSKTAFISSIQAININASKITSGTLDASKVTVSNLSASRITSGTLNANVVTISNLSVGSLTGFDATFMRTKWNNATGGGVSISDEGVKSVASDNSQVLIQNGRTLYRNSVGATLGSMGYQDYGASPYMTIQTSLGSHFRLSMRRDTLVGNSNDKHALTIMSGGYEMYLNTDNIYLTGDTTIQRGLSISNNLSLSGGEINGTNRVRFAKGAYLEEQSNGNTQLKSAGTQLQFYQSSGRIMYSDGTRLFLDLSINMQGNGVLNQSDARIKTDIRKIEQDSLSIIKGTDFVNYKMISNGRETFGFIAQQMQEIAPHLIKDEDGTLAFDSMEWTQTVAHGLQQLNNKVDENDNRINNRIKELESKIEMLELELKRARG